LNSGVITAIVFSAKLGASPSMQTLYSARNYYTAFSLFWGGSSWSSLCFPADSKLTFFFPFQVSSPAAATSSVRS
jgi:hypothetical protein